MLNALTLILLFFLAPVLTVILEFPIVYFSGTCRKPVYIFAVNVLTNLILNLTALLSEMAAAPLFRTVWIVLAEVLLIPNAEAQLYRLVSGQKLYRIYIFTYAANAFSFLVGSSLAAYL